MLRMGTYRSLGFLCACALFVASCGEREAPKTASAPSSGGYKVGNPYQISGAWYYPEVDYDYVETGTASWYGPGFHGKRTANGEVFDENDVTAAHRTLPMPSMVRVTNLDNGRSIEVRVNDRGPFAHNRIIDLSRRGAQLLGFEEAGTAQVRVEILEEESRQVAAIAQGQASGQGPQPSAAPLESVAAEPLSGTAPAPAPIEPALTAPTTTQTASASAVAGPSAAIYVQAGSFRDRSNAESLASRLQPIGRTNIQEAWINGQRYFRVRLPAGNAGEADRLLERLFAQGYTTARVVND